jgi:hypothetical protein
MADSAPGVQLFHMEAKRRQGSQVAGSTCKKPRFMDAKRVANLELSDFLTTFRRDIEHVRCSTPGPVPSKYDPIFEEVNRACQPLRWFINVTQRDGATMTTVHRQKALILQALDDMMDNPFASQMAAKLRVRFTTPADGIRCDAAAILSRDDHEEYCRYVVSWGSEDPSLSD